MKHKLNLSTLLLAAFTFIAFSCTNQEEVVSAKDPLPSWNEGSLKKLIMPQAANPASEMIVRQTD